MCGIVATHDRKRRPIDSDLFAQQCRAIVHRGPDDEGMYFDDGVAIGMRRLSIVDLAGGHQPIANEDESVQVVFNGEIYNSPELRKRLENTGHVFRTNSDTEVLVHMYEDFGSDLVKHLRGMFAFGVYDFRRDELVLVRDRCGVKPLFYTTCGGEFVFASSIAALRRHPRFSARPNMTALSHYLATLRLTLDEQTVFAGVQSLRPGELLRLRRDGRPELLSWWSLPEETNHEQTYDDAVGRFSRELQDSVRMRLKSDVDVGMLMSGGVDSNTLAVQVNATAGAGVRGICGGGLSHTAGTDDDFYYARKCADHLQFDFSDTRVDANQYYELWQDLLDDYATPVSTPTDVIIYRVCQQLKQHVGVALGGEGADEILCGYEIPHWSGTDFDRSRALHALSPAASSLARASLQRQYGRDQFESPGEHYLSASSLIPLSLQRQLFRDEHVEAMHADNAVQHYYDRFFPAESSRSTSEHLAQLLHRVNLEALLSRLDSASMRASLETRVPYTDHKLVELAFRMPHHYRIDVAPEEKQPWLSSLELSRRGSLRSKRILRSIANQLLPAPLANRPKASFPTPLAGWLHTDWRERIAAEFTRNPFAEFLFKPAALREIVNMPEALSMWKWPVLNILVWGRRCFV